MLSPNETTGLRAQLTQTLQAALDAQREGSALSRLVKDISASNQNPMSEFKKAGEGMQAKGADLATRADGMHRELERQIETIDEQLGALRAPADDST